MREFKFRVWSEDRKMFVMDGMSIDHIQKDAAESLELPIIIATEKCVWQQYTGLKDENGKDIYEGDIVKYTQHIFNSKNTSEKIKSVRWRNYLGAFNLFETAAGESDFVIIGNIFENPELPGVINTTVNLTGD